ncbi:uncharacterized protein LOC128388166 isoform X2 [Panonychus citri]|uniref:uncharacterized protein LOC128388166 isoform X2 n=1 Tax=Panonychus citri TaxID=50023 RepID=UPI00230737EA|nr:uncharacterized protein LOC128388166 isoform X2 [Panonychus citri]
MRVNLFQFMKIYSFFRIFIYFLEIIKFVTMELGDLPYDCLSYIFDCFSNLKLLLNLSTVCKQWNILVKQRLKKIRHLHVANESYLSRVRFSSDNHIYTDDVGLMERVNVSQFLPNLKFLSLSPVHGDKCTGKMMVNILSTTANPLVGFKCDTQCCSSNIVQHSGQVHVDEIVKHCGSLEYMNILDEDFLESYFFKYKFGQNLKHFDCYFIWYIDDEEDEDEDEDVDYDSRFEEINLLCRYLKQMPNLEVLNLGKPLIEPRLWPLPKMKLKEIRFEDIRSSSSVFQFLPLFPDLRTIRLDILEVKDKGFSDSYTHLNVQDVVLDIYEQDSPVGLLNPIKSILVKFPNCTNLYSDFLRTITKEDLIEIIKILPNLTLIVLNRKNCGDANTIETLDKFCKSVGRRINFILYGDCRTSDPRRTRSYTHFALNEDVARPLKIDNEFLQKYVY